MGKILADPYLTFNPHCQGIIVITQKGEQRTFVSIKTPKITKFVSEEISKNGFEQIKMVLPQECNKEENLDDLKEFLSSIPLKSKEVNV